MTHIESDKLEKEVQRLFINRTWTLSVAESCTGGAISARLVRQPGASEYFLGGIIAYSNDLKRTLLHVSEKDLLGTGAVSQECAAGMLQGLLESTKSDFGVAVTGIAGPSGGSDEKPVGTIWIAVGRKGHLPQIRQIKASGNRETIIEGSVNAALNDLLQYCSSIS